MSQETNTTDWRAGLGARLDRQDEQMQKVIKRADDQSGQIDSIRGELQINTDTTKRIEKDTSEMLDVFKSWQGAMKVLEFIGKAAKPLAAIATLSAAIGAWWLNWRIGK